MERDRNDTTSLRFWLWLAVIALGLAGGGFRLWQNLHREVAHAVWLSQRNRISAARDACLTRVRGLRTSGPDGRWPRYTRADLEGLLNDDRAFEPVEEASEQPDGTSPGTSPERWKWTDPASGVVWEFTFHDGLWSGCGLRKSAPAVLAPPQPKPTPLDALTHTVQRAFCGSFSLGWGTLAWLVGLGLYAFWRERRRTLAEVLLALTLLCGTGWLTWPSYSLTLRGIMSNDMLFWGVIMLVVSVGLIVHARWTAERPSYPACARCGYNLTGNVSGVCPECGEPAVEGV